MLRGCGGKSRLRGAALYRVGHALAKVEGGGGAVHWTVQNREPPEREVAAVAAQGGGAEGGAAAPWMGEARPRISSPGEQSMSRREQRRAPWLPAADSRGKKMEQGWGAEVDGSAGPGRFLVMGREEQGRHGRRRGGCRRGMGAAAPRHGHGARRPWEELLRAVVRKTGTWSSRQEDREGARLLLIQARRATAGSREVGDHHGWACGAEDTPKRSSREGAGREIGVGASRHGREGTGAWTPWIQGGSSLCAAVWKKGTGKKKMAARGVDE
ncbi:hypothetical protein Zm00014a_040926 [Zea mays]|uniref:Uncharacterized protein n=1 Tax=Zea mays TaxID=4577 RepID=A0A3L6EED6_MAIZE|nr:hypothetical protein Zm00014a_040926 [Zea mays]